MSFSISPRGLITLNDFALLDMQSPFLAKRRAKKIGLDEDGAAEGSDANMGYDRGNTSSPL